ncbi:4-vinyl reductase [Faecalispora anaeroviscerum]|uniref:4-vinyl reductase n=1 Tax=Faecalispora anaeroviscerum TaxID=2991836 RepID=UPI0024B994E3|nr:4-vinyl reductase [Faecalispora anaeroviscerum]
MFKLFNPEDENKFTWESISDVIDGRRNLGENMPVYVYRLFQFTIKDELAKRFGNNATVDIFRNAGELAGKEFANHLLNLELPFNEFVAHLQGVLEESKIGILRIEKFDMDTGEAVLTVGEDLDCSGLPITGETVCNYDEGFLAGILKVYTKKEYIVTEVDCWATGSRVCRFEANIKKSDEMSNE